MSDAPSPALGEAMPPNEVVPLRHPWTWAASAVVGVIAVAALFSVATNPAFEWPVVARYMFDEQILLGLSRTLELTVIAMAMGLGLGTVLAVMRLSRNLLLSTVSWLYIWFFRSVPVLVQLIFWYNFGALYAHITLRIPFGPVLYSANTNTLITPLFAALAGLGLAQAAYTAEVIRGGIVSVPRGQTKAALALGMRPATIFVRIVFPQAMALAELLYTAQLIYARTYETIPLLIVASLWYLAIVSILSVGQHFLERRYRQRT
jgi:polar amino acid transport system permease protein